MSARPLALPIVLAIAAAAACGPEDIDLAASRAGPDATAVEGGRFDDDAGPIDCDARSVSATCQALGARCGSDGDCCSVHCAAGACAVPGACAGANTACTSPAQCCSGRCEPTAGSTMLFCLDECQPAGAPCSRASDCCDLGCNGVTCTGPECLREGSDCTADVQCCSNECDAEDGGRGKCVIDMTATCRGSGEDCTSGGSGKCCDLCDPTGRCDPGAGASCRPLGAVCVTSEDCCLRAPCSDDGTGRLLCTSALLADGVSCVASFECASASCIGDKPPTCGSAAPSCVVTGASCTGATPCCSGPCADGVCQPSPCKTPP
jgi:hypothetical protein